VSTTTDALARAWPEGTPVTLCIDGVIIATGRVSFVEDGWVHWNEPTAGGRVHPHASRPDVLRKWVGTT
jgi:hypothetical protein